MFQLNLVIIQLVLRQLILTIHLTQAVKTDGNIEEDSSRIPNKPSKIEFPEDKDHNGKISDDENKAGDKDHGKTTVDVTVPTDGSVKPGDKVVIRDENGNEVKDKRSLKKILIMVAR